MNTEKKYEIKEIRSMRWRNKDTNEIVLEVNPADIIFIPTTENAEEQSD